MMINKINTNTYRYYILTIMVNSLHWPYNESLTLCCCAGYTRKYYILQNGSIKEFKTPSVKEQTTL